MVSVTNPETASPAERFRLREFLALWNRALDRADLAVLRRLTLADASFAYEDAAYDGPGALDRFVAARAGRGDFAQRTHVNHLQAWRLDDGFRTRAMSMIVHMRADTSPFGDGAPTAAWVGYTEDIVCETDDGPRIAARRFVRWHGFLGARPGPREGDTA